MPFRSLQYSKEKSKMILENSLENTKNFTNSLTQYKLYVLTPSKHNFVKLIIPSRSLDDYIYELFKNSPDKKGLVLEDFKKLIRMFP